jgi:hypothetical protein
VTRYARVKVNRRTYLIEVAREDRDVVAGWRVDRHGERLGREVAGAFQETFVIARRSDVLAWLAVDLHYGTLEETK